MKPSITNYSVGELLNRGVISWVYAAQDKKGNEVVIKLMKETPFVDRKQLREVIDFLEKYRVSLIHPNIVAIYETGETDGCFYVTMERVRGPGTLEQVIDNSRCQLGQALQLGLDIANGLLHAHAGNVVHGDVKPANVLIDHQLTAKLNDFGAANLSSLPARGIGSKIVGTPKYMSPQQARGAFISRHSDIYSFGVVLYEMVTGNLPYDLSKSINIQRMSTIINKSPPLNPLLFDRKIPDSLCEFLLKLLNKDEENGYSDMSRVRDDLCAVIGDIAPKPKTKIHSIWHKIIGGRP